MEFTMTQYVKIAIGPGCADKLGEIVASAGYKKAMLVFDEGLKKGCVVDKLAATLSAAGIEYIEFDKVLPDPPEYIVDEGLQVFRENGCDCLVAIGGGSSIDTAKGINILRHNSGRILDYLNHEPENDCPGLIAIPTTSGTGSELSLGVVITDTKNCEKLSIVSPKAMCEYALLDPELTASMPKGLTIATGLDVFSHALEGYTTNMGNAMNDLICEKAMETVVEFLPRAVEDGNDMQAREKMQSAAAFGGWSLTCAGAHIGHGVAHAIGAKYHITHGFACAYGLPPVLKWLAKSVPAKVKKTGEILGAEFVGNETPEELGEKAAAAYVKFRDEVLGVKKIQEYQINTNADSIESMVDFVEGDPVHLLAPAAATREELRAILSEAVGA